MVIKHRGLVMGKNGMVASANPLISLSGIEVLKNGGNAIDAAIAMALTSGVVLPDMTTLGADAFLLYYDAKTKKVTAINGSGAAPKKATINYFKENNYLKVPNIGMLSSSVPGGVSVYYKALELWGSQDFATLAKDAIFYARNGVAIHERVARHSRVEQEKLKQYASAAKLYLRENGDPLEPGDIVVNEDYAKTLEYLCREGKEGFYGGDIAKKIVDHSNLNGGLFTLEDFKNYECDVLEPISIDYHGYKVFQTPPVSQGIIHLEELNIVKNFPLKQMGLSTAETIHHLVEAKKIAFKDRLDLFGDPKFVNNPTDKVLSDGYGKQMANLINPTKATNFDDLLNHQNEHTTSFVVVDKLGNAVSFIHSISGTWGSYEVIEGTGMLLNNRAGTGFNLNENHPNHIAPGKKTMHTLNTWLILKDNKLKWVGNTPGGDNQPQWNLQMVTNLIDFGLDVQQAVETPKWMDHQVDGIHTLSIEKQAGDDVIKKLKEYGHKINVLAEFGATGASQIIELKDNKTLVGASDPRADGCALGF